MYNNNHGIKTNFYLETPFTKENQRTALKVGYDIMTKRKLLQRDIDYHKDLIDHQFDVVSWLNLFEFLVEPCFIRDKMNCPFYPNVHLHYADVRFVDGTIPLDIDPYILHDIQRHYKNKSYNVKDFNTLLYILIFQHQLIFKMMFTTKQFDHYLTGLINLSSFLSEPMKSLYVHKFENINQMTVVKNNVRMHRVAAELLKLKSINPIMSNKIKKFILKEADRQINRLKIIYNDYIADIESNIRHDSEDIDNFTELLLPIAALSMDAYLLSRMFLQQSEEIVIYAGSHHIATYAKFLSTLTEPVIESPSIPDNRCLTINNLPDYLDINQYKDYVIINNLL